MQDSPRDAIEVRLAIPEDGPRLTALVRGLLRALGDPEEAFDGERFLTDAFGDDPQFDVRVAESEEGELVGYALYHDAYEPAHAARGTYLSDLFVVDEARRRGIGRRLLESVVADTRARDRSFVWWVVRPRSDAALAFFRRQTEVRAEVAAHALVLDREG